MRSVGYRCIDECREETVEVYVPGSDVCYIVKKDGQADTVHYRDQSGTVSFDELIAVLHEDEAWCPVHEEVLTWEM
jgi:hypothetical protein